MGLIRIRLPESLHSKAVEITRKEGIPLDQFIILAVAEKLTALEVDDRWRQRQDTETHRAGNTSDELLKHMATEPGGVSVMEKATPDFDEVWKRMELHQGEVFFQKLGGEFRYEIKGSYVRPDRTNQNISRRDFERAYNGVPFQGTSELQHLRGPSYIYAILMDDRIRRGDW